MSGNKVVPGYLILWYSQYFYRSYVILVPQTNGTPCHEQTAASDSTSMFPSETTTADDDYIPETLEDDSKTNFFSLAVD